MNLNTSKLLKPLHSYILSLRMLRNESNFQNLNTFKYSVGQFQHIPSNIFKKLFTYNGFENYQSESFEIMNDTSIMVRKPFLEIINLIEKTDFTRPVNRFLLYGRYGSGKSYILNHLAYYGYMNQFILIHHASPLDWIETAIEVSPSDSRPGRLDMPINAALALKHFKSQNEELVEKLDLKVSKKYVWSLREETNTGDPLMHIVNHGISRMKHSDDCYAVLLKELKLLANEEKCKLMVLGDSVNLYYSEIPKIKHPDDRIAGVEEINLPRAFMRLFNNDWKGGVIIVSVNSRPIDKSNNLDPYTPKFLLGDIGFEVFDPFIPIKVNKYTQDELDRCLDYYIERKFIYRPEAKTPIAREEIKFLTGQNPLEIYMFSRAL